MAGRPGRDTLPPAAAPARSRRRGRRRVLAVAAVLAVLATACTVTRAEAPAPQAAGGGGGGDRSGGASGGSGLGSESTQGVTDEAITVSMLAVDLQVLADQGLAPSIGNPVETAEAVVADINDHGGINGRELVLVPHLLDVQSAILDPSSGQRFCIDATEGDEPLATIVAAALPSELVRCVAVTHPVVAMTMNQWDDPLYQQAEGRLFSCCSNTSISLDRAYAAWPGLMLEAGAVRPGAKVGIISQQGGGTATDQREALADALEPALEDAGLDLVAQAELPCPENSQDCTQHSEAVQRMEAAGAEAVFLTAANLAGAATVKAAADIGYQPQWMTIGDNATDTVARFFAPSAEAYDGAYGVTTVFQPPSADADACNRIAADAGVRTFPVGEDGYGFTAVTCLQVQVLAQALRRIQGDVTQRALIAALEDMHYVPTAHGPEGSFAADKHGAGNALGLVRYSAEDGRFTPVEGIAPQVVP